MAGAIYDDRVTIRKVAIVFAIALIYILISGVLVGFKPGQLVLIGVFCIFYFSSPITRKFITGFLIFFAYWIIFDYMKAFPNYNYNHVHIADVYNLEKHLFGINYQGKLITVNEYWRLNSKTILDVCGGIFYLCWVPVPLAFAAYLFFKDRRQFLYFSFTFLLVNLIGFITYYLYPAAPPWYVEFYGFNFHAGTPGNTAGLVRFDNFFHTGIFKSIYSQGSNVFAAMPSLHSAYPVVVLYYGLKNRLGAINIFFITVMLGIWFTAVYESHHYILDVLAGILCAFAGISLFNLIIRKSSFVRLFLNKYLAVIQ